MVWIKEDEGYADLPNVIKCMSINPEVMNAVIEMGHKIGFGSSSLSREQEEIIATVVSAINNCEYWVVSHGELLRQASGDAEFADAVMHEYGIANFDEQTLVIVEYVEKLTKTPSQVTREDVSALRSVGLDDQQILSVVLITSMYAFMNRLADGLGVQLDKEKRAFVESWSKSLSPPN